MRDQVNRWMDTEVVVTLLVGWQMDGETGMETVRGKLTAVDSLGIRLEIPRAWTSYGEPGEDRETWRRIAPAGPDPRRGGRHRRPQERHPVFGGIETACIPWSAIAYVSQTRTIEEPAK